MAIEVSLAVWRVQFPTPTQKLIMLRIADFSSVEGDSIWASNAYLAECVQCDERSIQRAMKAFRSCGLLHLKAEGGKGPKSTNQWWLNVPLLKALADGDCKLVGSASSLEIDGEQPVDNKGDSLSPLDDDKGDKSEKRVTPVSSKGDSIVSPNTSRYSSLDTSTRERARESDGSRPSRAFKAATTITPTDAQWSHWVTWWSDRDRRDMVRAAEGLGRIVASSKWPGETTAVYEPKAGNITDRILGEAE